MSVEIVIDGKLRKIEVGPYDSRCQDVTKAAFGMGGELPHVLVGGRSLVGCMKNPRVVCGPNLDRLIMKPERKSK